VIDDLRAEVTRLLKLGGSLDPDDWNEPSRCEGWTIGDVFAHLCGDFERWARWLGAALSGDLTQPFALEQLAADNAALLEQYAGVDPPHLLVALERSAGDYINRLANVLPSVPQAHPRGTITVGDQILWAASECALHGWDIATALDMTWEAPAGLPRIYNAWLHSPLPPLPEDEADPWTAILRASGRNP
jgi:uncharacterized protein (TIGR03083 family)